MGSKSQHFATSYLHVVFEKAAPQCSEHSLVTMSSKCGVNTSISHKILALDLVWTLALSSGRSPDLGVPMHTFSAGCFCVVPEVPVIQCKGAFQSWVRLFGKGFRVNQRKGNSYQHRQECRKLHGAAGKLAKSASCAASGFSCTAEKMQVLLSASTQFFTLILAHLSVLCQI